MVFRFLIACSLVAGFSLYSPISFAHGGGLDANGGHHNRKTGTYHCHRSYCGQKRSSAPRSSFSNGSPAAKSNRSQIKAAQTMLVTLGYDAGDIDGYAGRKTRQAVLVFNIDRKNPASSQINDALILELSQAIQEKMSPKS